MAIDDDFARAGLLDAAHAGKDRRELLVWLDEQGFSLDEMVAADANRNLAALASDRRILPGERHGRADVLDTTGLTPDRLGALVVALGVQPESDAGSDGLALVDGEVELLTTFRQLEQLFTPDEILGLARVVGSAMARMAEAAVSIFLADVESRLLPAGEELTLAKSSYTAVGMLDGLAGRLDPLLRRHIRQTVERTRGATVDDQRLQYRFAIAFVDLVGFTERTHSMRPEELAAFVRDFEARAHELAMAFGARVVKLIGDEVMLAATDPTSACDAAAALVRGFEHDGDRVVPRGGLAWGEVLTRGGDYYGSVVNLASRLVQTAVPGEILATTELVEATGPGRFDPAGRRMVKGFDDPIEVWSLHQDQ